MLEDTRMKNKIDKLSMDLDDLSKGIARPEVKSTSKRTQSLGRSNSAEENPAMAKYHSRRASMKKHVFQVG